MKCIVVVGTYNEAENIGRLLADITALGPAYHALIVDDSSPDGTGDIVAEAAARNAQVHLLSRPSRLGYGTAYVDGFKRALEMGADYIVQMDADYSHDPQDIPRLVEAAKKGADLAVGSRYVKGGGTKGWPLRRRIISGGINLIARTLLGLPLKDCSGGFKCFRRVTLESLNLSAIRSKGFSLHYETSYFCQRSGRRFVEVPIVFVDRQLGRSKLSLKIMIEAFMVILALRFGGKRRVPLAVKTQDS